MHEWRIFLYVYVLTFSSIQNLVHGPWNTKFINNPTYCCSLNVWSWIKVQRGYFLNEKIESVRIWFVDEILRKKSQWKKLPDNGPVNPLWIFFLLGKQGFLLTFNLKNEFLIGKTSFLLGKRFFTGRTIFFGFHLQNCEKEFSVDLNRWKPFLGWMF